MKKLLSVLTIIAASTIFANQESIESKIVIGTIGGETLVVQDSGQQTIVPGGCVHTENNESKVDQARTRMNLLLSVIPNMKPDNTNPERIDVWKKTFAVLLLIVHSETVVHGMSLEEQLQWTMLFVRCLDAKLKSISDYPLFVLCMKATQDRLIGRARLILQSIAAEDNQGNQETAIPLPLAEE